MTSESEKHQPDGQHLIAEFSDCDAKSLDDAERLGALLREAAAATASDVLSTVTHRFRPEGVTGCLLLKESHVTIHTWPEAGYAAVDFYTSCGGAFERFRDALKSGLQAQSVETIVVDRGLAGDEHLKVRSHKRVASYTLECFDLPDSIRIARSPGRGFGMFATRDMSEGELVYHSRGTLAEWNAEFIVLHPAGRSVHSADSLGYELSPELIKTWPQTMLDQITKHYELANPTPDQIRQSITDDYEYEVLITDFDGLKNHSNDANTRIDWDGTKFRFNSDEQPEWTVATVAKRDIKSGEELSVDYRDTLFDFVPPEDWL